MPLIFLAMYSYWWKAALKPKEPSVIALMPEVDAPELAVTSPSPARYEG